MTADCSSPLGISKFGELNDHGRHTKGQVAYIVHIRSAAHKCQAWTAMPLYTEIPRTGEVAELVSLGCAEARIIFAIQSGVQ